MSSYHCFDVERKMSQNKISLNWLEISNYILEIIEKESRQYEGILVLCIGSDRSTGDSLGPLTGTFLKETYERIEVVGTLDEPVHAMNLADVVSNISTENKLIIVVDAAMGEVKGKIGIKQGSIAPGQGIGRQFDAIGDVSIAGIVNKDFGKSEVNKRLLASTSLNEVYSMARCIARALHYAFYRYNKIFKTA